MRLDRPIGILLLAWPMLWALWLAADGTPSPWVLTVFLLGTVLMRSAGCVINDWADRDFDGHVERTRQRPLATGEVTPRQALSLFAVLLAASAALVLTTNGLTILLACAGAALAASYPFAKRYTHLPQVHLGAAFGWAVPMAFAAETGGVPTLGWLLFAITLLWAVIYDTQYAMVDRADDLRIGIKSTAILFGRADRLVIALLQVTMLGLLAFVGVLAALRWPWYAGLTLAALLFAYQQYLIRRRDRAGCFAAFLNNNWVGAVLFLGLLVEDWAAAA